MIFLLGILHIRHIFLNFFFEKLYMRVFLSDFQSTPWTFFYHSSIILTLQH